MLFTHYANPVPCLRELPPAHERIKPTVYRVFFLLFLDNSALLRLFEDSKGQRGPRHCYPNTGAPKTGVSTDCIPSRGCSRLHSRQPGERLDVSDELISSGTEPVSECQVSKEPNGTQLGGRGHGHGHNQA
jgi:hypothetical protein